MSLHLEVRIGNIPLMDACPRRFSDVYGPKKCTYKKMRGACWEVAYLNTKLVMDALFSQRFARASARVRDAPYMYSIRCEVWIWRDLAISPAISIPGDPLLHTGTWNHLYRYRRAIGEAVNDAPGCCRACCVLPLSLYRRSFLCTGRPPALQAARKDSPVLPSHSLQGAHCQGAGTQGQ